MRCDDCGAEPSGEETCLDRFHALLAAEVDNEELRRMHGPTVLTYPIPGEATVAAVELDAPTGQAEQVLEWAHSVAAHRGLERGGAAGGGTEDRPEPGRRRAGRRNERRAGRTSGPPPRQEAGCG